MSKNWLADRWFADDFIARSSDELSLSKGDRVELIERDDEFGDGWFLGRHMVNGNSGLFPEGMCPYRLAPYASTYIPHYSTVTTHMPCYATSLFTVIQHYLRCLKLRSHCYNAATHNQPLDQ